MAHFCRRYFISVSRLWVFVIKHSSIVYYLVRERRSISEGRPWHTPWALQPPQQKRGCGAEIKSWERCLKHSELPLPSARADKTCQHTTSCKQRAWAQNVHPWTLCTQLWERVWGAQNIRGHFTSYLKSQIALQEVAKWSCITVGFYCTNTVDLEGILSQKYSFQNTF